MTMIVKSKLYADVTAHVTAVRDGRVWGRVHSGRLERGFETVLLKTGVPDGEFHFNAYADVKGSAAIRAAIKDHPTMKHRKVVTTRFVMTELPAPTERCEDVTIDEVEDYGDHFMDGYDGLLELPFRIQYGVVDAADSMHLLETLVDHLDCRVVMKKSKPGDAVPLMIDVLWKTDQASAVHRYIYDAWPGADVTETLNDPQWQKLKIAAEKNS